MAFHSRISEDQRGRFKMERKLPSLWGKFSDPTK